MQLSRATLELLRDEAYVILCRETLQESLKGVERDREQLVNSRPPFGVLAGKKAREAFETSLKTTDETEAALRDRLTRTVRFETWLHRCIRRELAVYLEAASAEYQRVTQIKRMFDEWEDCVKRYLPDTLVAFVREMRALRLAAGEVGRVEQACTHELALLREIAVRVEELQDRLSRISNTVNAHALQIGLLDVHVPPLPQFRRGAWVDWLCMIPLDQAVADVTRAEAELRAFLHNGMQNVAGRLQASRVSCAQAQEKFLQQYWDQLRAHAQAHWVEERDIDQVLDALAERYEADIVRRQREVTHNPFMSEP
jgi:hypothetical protein